MNRVYLTIIAILIALLALLGWQLDGAKADKAALAEQNKALTEAAARAVERQKADRQVLVARQAKIAAKQRELKKAQEALSEALQRNNDWRDTNVPDEVQKALGGPSGGPAARL